MNHRIIARMDIKGPNLVKGIHLEGLRVLGKPEHFARYYYESGVDELLFMDVVASLYNRNSLNDIISRTADEIFIPLTVGGGIRTIEDITNVLRAGADKVSINTAAINNPEFIREASRSFGSSTIVVAIEAIKQPDGAYLAFVDNGREYTGVEVIQWAKRVEELGAGEIMLTSVDREGTGKGFDTFLTKAVSDVVSIPVIAHGGCGKKEDIKDIIVDGHSDAVAVSSMIHYEYLSKVRNIEGFEAEGNIDFLKSGDSYNKVSKANIREIKTYLRDNNIECRFE